MNKILNIELLYSRLCLHTSSGVRQAGAYLDFWSMKWLGIFPLPPGWVLVHCRVITHSCPLCRLAIVGLQQSYPTPVCSEPTSERAAQERLPGSFVITCQIHLHRLCMMMVPMLSWFTRQWERKCWLEMVLVQNICRVLLLSKVLGVHSGRVIPGIKFASTHVFIYMHLIETSWNLTQERHFSANGCLLPLCAVDGMAVTTVEGIGSTKTALHPVQVMILYVIYKQ